MNSITGLTPQQLRQAADLQEQILDLQSQLAQILGGEAPAQRTQVPAQVPAAPGKKRRLSPQGLANIRAGVLKRQRRRQLESGSALSTTTRKGGKHSAAANRARAESMRKRWAAARAAGQKRL